MNIAETEASSMILITLPRGHHALHRKLPFTYVLNERSPDRMGTPTLSAGGVLKCGQIGSLCRNFIALHGLVWNRKIAISGRREHFSANYSRRRTPAKWSESFASSQAERENSASSGWNVPLARRISGAKKSLLRLPIRALVGEFPCFVCTSSSGTVLRFRL